MTMRKMMKLVCMDLVHCLCRWKNLFLLFSCMLLLYASIHEKLAALWKYGKTAGAYEAAEILFEVLYFDRFKGILVTLFAALCSYVMSDEIRTGFCTHVLSRGIKVRTYAVSKLLANAVTVIVFCQISFILYTVTLNQFYPAAGLKDNPYVGYFGEIYRADTYWLIAVFAGLQFGLASLVLIHVGIMVSVVFPKKIISVAIPYIVYSFLFTLSGQNISIPSWLDFFLLSSCVDVLRVGRFLPNFICSNLILLFMALLTGIVCTGLAEWRHSHGFF